MKNRLTIMKNLCILFFIATSTVVVAQKVAIKNIAITYSADRQYLPDEIRTTSLNRYYDVKPANNNFTAGITTEIALLSRLSVRTGLLYSNRDFTGYFACYMCLYEQGNILIPKLETIRQRYLDVPLSARFYLISGRLNLFGDAGLVGNFLIQNGTKVEQHEMYQVNSNDFLLSWEGGIGTSYSLNKHIDVSLAAVYRSSLTEYIPKDEMQIRSFGVVGGLAYKFKQ
jgi:hypothetical protein